jgi:V8-like Glu-specific endopeptidase
MWHRSRFENELSDLGIGSFASEREVVDKDNRKPVSDSSVIPFRFVCHLEIAYKKTSGRKGGTGVLISPKHVLTAAHNIHTTDKLDARRIIVSPARNDDKITIGPVEGSDWWVHPIWDRGRANHNFDYAVIKLDKAIGSEGFIETNYKPLGYWGDPKNGGGTVMRPLPPNRVDGQTCFVAGYPGKGSKDNNLMKSDSGVISGFIQSHGMTADDLMFRHTADTSPGESGSPVWIREDNINALCLVGIHVMAGDQDKDGKYLNNLAVRITGKVITQVEAWMKL